MPIIRDLMNAQPHLIAPTATLRDAAKQMQEFDCGSLVVGIDGVPQGMLTDRDIVVYGLAENYSADESTVAEIMTQEIISCYEDETLEQAADTMSDCDVRRLVVLNRQEKVVGVVSIADMIKRIDRDEVNDEVVHHLFRYA